jgi:flagellar biosynthesis regulator FlaF
MLKERVDELKEEIRKIYNYNIELMRDYKNETRDLMDELDALYFHVEKFEKYITDGFKRTESKYDKYLR